MYINEFKPIRRADQIIERARALARLDGPRKIAVAVAENREVLEAVRDARELGLASAVLVGRRERIEALLEELGVSAGEFEIMDEPDPQRAVECAVGLTDRGEAQILMKGIVPTATLLHAVLSRRYGLRGPGILSHVAVLDIPGYHKLLALTDAGMVVKSTLPQRIDIVRNAVRVMHALGIERPKVAMLAAIDRVNLAMPVSMEAAIIAKMNERGQIEGAIVDGPMTLDLATLGKSAEEVGFRSPVAGDADVIVVDTLETGNILVKALSVLAGATFGGIVVGARVPLSLVSRSDSARNKIVSLALAMLVSSHVSAGVRG
jgi:phosphate butyryltransferase